jgi:hypothetical protein
MDSLDKYYLLGIAIAALAGVPGVSEATNSYFAHGYGMRSEALPVLHQDACRPDSAGMARAISATNPLISTQNFDLKIHQLSFQFLWPRRF